jgi:hypothetical protein
VQLAQLAEGGLCRADRGEKIAEQHAVRAGLGARDQARREASTLRQRHGKPVALTGTVRHWYPPPSQEPLALTPGIPRGEQPDHRQASSKDGRILVAKLMGAGMRSAPPKQRRHRGQREDRHDQPGGEPGPLPPGLLRVIPPGAWQTPSAVQGQDNRDGDDDQVPAPPQVK